jgi:hypothetical protein
MASQGSFEVHRPEYGETSGAEMNRTHLVFYRNSAGSNLSSPAPDALGGVAAQETLAPMRPAREACPEGLADHGHPRTDANPSAAGFDRRRLLDPASLLVEQLTIPVPAYGRIHQAIPA